jgi:hypothetical protein
MAFGLACNKATIHVLQAIWKCPRPTTVRAVEELTRVVQLSSNAKENRNGSRNLPYYCTWITGLDLSALDQESANSLTVATLTTLLCAPTLPLEILNTSHCTALVSTLVTPHIETLRELNLASCTQFSSASLIQILTHGSSSILTTLDLSNCSVNDAVIIRVSQHHTRLRHLCLRHSGNISDSAIIALADACLDLETIIIGLPHGIVQSNKITDRSMEILAKACPRLQKVICRGQTRITEKSLDYFRRCCSNLTVCDLSAEQIPSIH